MRIHDGAYGTWLAAHLHGGETVDDLSIRAPGAVIDAHCAYVDAGATAIQTNTFLTHLRGSSRRRQALRAAAVDCARHAAADRAIVLATIGPCGNEPRDWWEAIDHALEVEVDGIVCETITDHVTAEAMVAAWTDVAAGVEDRIVLLGCSVDVAGESGAQWVLDVAEDVPEVIRVGLNCCTGPVGARWLLEALCSRRGDVWFMPSAGLPTIADDGRHAWPLEEPEAWASALIEEVDGLPLTAIGGCCGTTPESIAHLVAPA